MIEPTDLVAAFERNTWIIEAQTEALSHEDSLIQTEWNINCLNWVLGHIVQGRDDMLNSLGQDRLFSPEVSERYARESDPVVEDGPNVLQLSELIGLVRQSQERIGEAIGTMTLEDFAAERTRGERTYTVGSSAHFRYFHDTYHTGQTELLRQIAGVGDKII
ncbi:MAG: DinB family protein [bacterium]|nr:DinB family protein [bacterium]